MVCYVLYTGTSTKQTITDDDTAVEMKQCAAYEVVSLSRQKVVMKGNPSYELHTVKANELMRNKFKNQH